MELNRLKYSKAGGHIELKEGKRERETGEEVNDHVLSEPDKMVPESYRKGQPLIETKLIFVISGGEKREKDYFHILLKDKEIRRLKVAFATKKGQGLHPKQMYKEALSFCKKKYFETDTDKFSIAEDDVIYLLSDLDEYEDVLKGLLEKKGGGQLRWIISNPAFEIWLYYHYFQTPEAGLKEKMPEAVSERSQWLKRQLNKIVPGGINSVKAFENIEKAIKNSLDNYQEIKGIPVLYATQMHSLAQEIVGLLGEEFDEIWKRQTERIRLFKEKSQSLQSSIGISERKICEFISGLVRAEEVNIRLPRMQDLFCHTLPIVDAKVFSKAFKLGKEFLTRDDTNWGNLPEVFLAQMRQEIEYYFEVQFMLRPPMKVVTIKFSEVKKAFDLLGLNGSHVVISQGITLSTYDEIWGGEKDFIKQKDGYRYGDVDIFRLYSQQYSFFIMLREYMPRIEWRALKNIPQGFKKIDNTHLIYSNIHNVQVFPDGFGVSVLRDIHFRYPLEMNFKCIKLNVIYDEEGESELFKLNRGDMVRLQYEKGDFVRIKDSYKGDYKITWGNKSIFEIEEIKDDGSVKLRFIPTLLPIQHIEGIPVNGKDDLSIYYDPIVAAAVVRADDPIPVFRRDYSYYMDAFKRSQHDGEKTLFEAITEAKLSYVHEVQHWLRNQYRRSELKIKE